MIVSALLKLIAEWVDVDYEQSCPAAVLKTEFHAHKGSKERGLVQCFEFRFVLTNEWDSPMADELCALYQRI